MKGKILTLIVGRDDGVVQTYFGIEHENKLWLVTRWLINKATGDATPEQMIRIDSLNPKPTKLTPPDNDKFDYTNVLLPKDVIEGVTEDVPGFEIRSLPNEPVVKKEDLFMLPSVFE